MDFKTQNRILTIFYLVQVFLEEHTQASPFPLVNKKPSMMNELRHFNCYIQSIAQD